MDRELVGPCLDELAAAEGVVREPWYPARGGDLLPAVYLVAFHRAEQSLAGGLLALLNSRQERLPAIAGGLGQGAGLAAARTGEDLAPGQQEAAQLALRRKVAVLTGGPGCGKSFTVRSVVELAAPRRPRWCWSRPQSRPRRPPRRNLSIPLRRHLA